MGNRDIETSATADLDILKEGITKLLNEVRDPSRREIENLLGSRVMSIVASRTKASPKKKTPKIELTEKAKRSDQEELVRQRLRDAVSEDEIRLAIDAAKELDMLFEVSLGERKLAKLSETTHDEPTVSSRE
jgi:hypothetical protein